MNRMVMLSLAFGWLVVSLPLVSAAELNAEQAKAIAEIEKLGGKVILDKKSPGKPVFFVTWGIPR